MFVAWRVSESTTDVPFLFDLVMNRIAGRRLGTFVSRRGEVGLVCSKRGENMDEIGCSYTFCPSSHQPGCPPYFLLSLPACLSCSLFIYQLSVRFNLVVGSLQSPLDLCNTPTISFFE